MVSVVLITTCRLHKNGTTIFLNKVIGFQPFSERLIIWNTLSISTSNKWWGEFIQAKTLDDIITAMKYNDKENTDLRMTLISSAESFWAVLLSTNALLSLLSVFSWSFSPSSSWKGCTIKEKNRRQEKLYISQGNWNIK